jgi:hypothetical protein
VTFRAQGPGSREHEYRRVRIDHGLGEPDGTEAEQVTGHDQCKLQQDDTKNEPGRDAAYA